jgi:5-methylcytosine-specific restriction endonuclease McrA
MSSRKKHLFKENAAMGDWRYKAPKMLPGLRKAIRKREDEQFSRVIDYDAYIKSQRWANFRKAWFNCSGLPAVCVGCSAVSTLELHHVTYERLGCERMNDVVPLCKRCHKEFHERYTSHQCHGLEGFQRQLAVAFRLSPQVVAIRLRKFFAFTVPRPHVNRPNKKTLSKSKARKLTAQAKSSLRFQAYHDKYSPVRHDPLR